MLAISYSHRDCAAAARLIKWIGHLSPDMRGEKLLLVPSKMLAGSSWAKQIRASADAAFGEVDEFVPPDSVERGWPISPNYMFGQALSRAEAAGEDIFWMEPDAVPLVPDWFHQLKAEYDACGKPFMGAAVERPTPHMTGVAWYAHNWREAAPSLGTATNMAWDVWARDEVLPNAHITTLIHHIFNNPVIRGLQVVRPGAVVFHQDKTHQLIRLLDEQRGGRFFNGKADVVENKIMDTYYHTTNVRRRIQAAGIVFEFEATALFGGAWAGVYKTDKETEQLALLELISNPASGVREITKERYDREVAKKKPTSRVYQSPPLISQGQTLEEVTAARAVSVPFESRQATRLSKPPPAPPAVPAPPPPPAVADVVKTGPVLAPEGGKPKRRKG